MVRWWRAQVAVLDAVYSRLDEHLADEPGWMPPVAASPEVAPLAPDSPADPPARPVAPVEGLAA